jgi:hypothetical protein
MRLSSSHLLASIFPKEGLAMGDKARVFILLIYNNEGLKILRLQWNRRVV